MFCKVCQDAGKPSSVYTSHSVRDDKGIVRCSTLLNQSCKYCKINGHTTKYCPQLKKKGKSKSKNTTATATAASATIAAIIKPQPQTQEQLLCRRARELCASPPPPSFSSFSSSSFKGQVIPFVPTPIGKKPNYFTWLKIEPIEEDEDNTAIADADAKRERETKKEMELTKFKETIAQNYPHLPEKTNVRIIASVACNNPSVWKKPSSVKEEALYTAARKREDSPTPSTVSPRLPTPPQASSPPPPSAAAPYLPPLYSSWADMEVD